MHALARRPNRLKKTRRLVPLSCGAARDAGAHWISLPLPALQGAWCEVQVAADDPAAHRTIRRRNSNYPACDGAPLYLSDNGGDSWKRIASPAIRLPGAMPSSSDCTFWPTAHHLFFVYSYERGSHINPAGRAAPQLSNSRGATTKGRTWARADRPIDGDKCALLRRMQLRTRSSRCVAAGSTVRGTLASFMPVPRCGRRPTRALHGIS